MQREKRFVTLVGEDPRARRSPTISTPTGSASTASRSAPIARRPSTIDADDFVAENLTFENAAGPVGQALAIRVDGDRVAFRNCRFLGWQDTIFLDRGRQYFEDVFIAGHVDFIFGGATAYFERSHVHCWGDGYITAASTPPERAHGFVFANGRITGQTPDVRTYLGRPWRDFAQVAFLNTEMSEVVRPEGWHNWDRPEREQLDAIRRVRQHGRRRRSGGRVAWAEAAVGRGGVRDDGRGGAVGRGRLGSPQRAGASLRGQRDRRPAAAAARSRAISATVARP